MKPIKLFILVFFFAFNVFSQVKTEQVKFEDLPAKVNKNPMASVMLKLPNKEAVLDNLIKQTSGKGLESDGFTFGNVLDFYLVGRQ